MANITGSGTADTLNDGAGDDTITGFAGDDTIIVSLGGTDSVDGGADNDRLVLDARVTGGGVNMAAPNAGAGSASWTNAQVSFQNIENFTIYSSAGSFADNVTTGAGDDVFTHYGMDNTSYAADTIDLGAGTNDLLVADFSALTTHNVVGYLNYTPGHNLLTVDKFTKIDFTNVERLHLIGSALVDNVTGLVGDDILEGRAGNDTLDGAAGNDILDGGQGDDTLTGGAGNDSFIIVNGSDSAAGGTDSDTLTINYGDATANFTTNAGPAANLGTGGYDGQYTIDATRRVSYSSIEHFDITTGTGNDTITTATGNDVVHAGNGDDLVNVGSGLDSADGGIGTDRISADMSAVTGAVSWNLQANSYSGPAGTSFTNFEYFGTVRTGSGNDNIVTTDLQQDETIDVGGGDNSVTVRNGRDDVTAGSGFDTLIVDYSNATTSISSLGASPPAGPQPSANGFDGYFRFLSNRFVIYHGFDTFDVRTGSGNDIITMGTGTVVTNDIVSLGSGDDIAVLGRGVDVADGGTGTDGLDADLSQVATDIAINLDANTFSGPAGISFTNFEYFTDPDNGFRTGTGNDTVVTRNADLDDSVRLGAGNDSVTVYNGTDFVVGYGLDTAAGAGGNDTLVVDYSAATSAITTDGGFLQADANGNGWDGRLTDGAGGTRFLMFYGFDRFDITTGSGNDVLNYFNLNTAANNVFHLGAGNDSVNLSQSTGTNFFDGGTGNDTMTGGMGNDTYVVDSASDVVNDFFGGVDTIQTSLASYTLATDLENLTGIGNFNQNLTGNASANVIDGGAGSDSLFGLAGNDTLKVTGGTTGADTPVESVDGGADNDVLLVDYSQLTEQVGLYVQSDGAGGATGFADIPDGARRLNFTGVERLWITTGSGDDTVYGFQGDDVIATGVGNDLIIAGAGNDWLDGGAGDDGFLFGAAFTALDHVDGGAGTNDQIGLEGNYTGGNALVLGAGTIANIEALVVLAGFSYDITTVDENVAAGAVLKVQATQLAAGEGLTFDGSAESDGAFLVFGGNGDDNFTGGAGNDGFYFGPGQYSAADVVNGGTGSNDQLGLDGDYGSVGTPFSLGANISNIDVVVLLAGPSATPNHFNIAATDALVGAGQTMTIFGLQVSTGFTFDGTGEHDGMLRIYGGTGDDVLTGGDNNDWLFGGDGADTRRGGAGNNTFYYDAVSQSTPSGRDGIQDFDTGDIIDVSGIDAIAGGGNDAFTFIGSGPFTNQAGQLQAVNTSGPIWTVSGDVDGDGVADFQLVVVVTDAHPLAVGDFTF
jgi:Ca2+-binding RTX toxin-like protein